MYEYPATRALANIVKWFTSRQERKSFKPTNRWLTVGRTMHDLLGLYRECHIMQRVSYSARSAPVCRAAQCASPKRVLAPPPHPLASRGALRTGDGLPRYAPAAKFREMGCPTVALALGRSVGGWLAPQRAAAPPPLPAAPSRARDGRWPLGIAPASHKSPYGSWRETGQRLVAMRAPMTRSTLLDCGPTSAMLCAISSASARSSESWLTCAGASVSLAAATPCSVLAQYVRVSPVKICISAGTVAMRALAFSKRRKASWKAGRTCCESDMRCTAAQP
mmetsp:Transcript_49469/g.114328  ORF Transcript_49469/g.114328 Transcript_49469/m.114328 type:complete len:278 (-) Transcript_49469:129-962(-)